MQNKYKAKKTTRKVGKEIYTFDSKAEARFFDKLVLMLKAGEIEQLKVQPQFVVANAYRIDTTKTKSGKSKVGELKYSADFSYVKDGRKVVTEVKGYAGETAYRIRLKLFLHCAYGVHGVHEFVEVVNGKETRYFCDSVSMV